ncbi:hypothetical protein EK21DRAFT_109591 [Setomelanomma holmii]|uniref:Uncharacterized protein n=1 Tax=Setomelanomma holmii TaxID=210430 RepID=A0A9P4HDM7_9PLEO|nr:hypothetical protein EK21DRAFT_109591 [Setomelanomma holmii]
MAIDTATRLLLTLDVLRMSNDSASGRALHIFISTDALSELTALPADHYQAKFLDSSKSFEASDADALHEELQPLQYKAYQDITLFAREVLLAQDWELPARLLSMFLEMVHRRLAGKEADQGIVDEVICDMRIMDRSMSADSLTSKSDSDVLVSAFGLVQQSMDVLAQFLLDRNREIQAKHGKMGAHNSVLHLMSNLATTFDISASAHLHEQLAALTALEMTAGNSEAADKLRKLARLF